MGRDIRINSEEHAVRLPVSKTQALRISFAGGTASGESVLGAGRVEVVCRGVLGVTNDSASRSWCATFISV
jgi:hypothetical protein